MSRRYLPIPLIPIAASRGGGRRSLKRLNPGLCPVNLWANRQHIAFARVYFATRRYEDALLWIERGLRRYPGQVVFLKHQAAALALLGRIAEARQVVQHLCALADLTISRPGDVGAILYKQPANASAVRLASKGLPD